MSVSVRFSDSELNLIKAYVGMHNMTVSDFIRQSTIEKIEDEFDLKAYHKAMNAYKKDPTTYSHEEMRKILELD